MVGKPSLTGLGKSFAWALGPPIEMKIEPSRVSDQAWTAKIVATLDEVRPWKSLVWDACCEPIWVAPSVRVGRVVARDGV